MGMNSAHALICTDVHQVEQRGVDGSDRSVGSAAAGLDACGRSRGAAAQQRRRKVARLHPLQLQRPAKRLPEGDSVSATLFHHDQLGHDLAQKGSSSHEAAASLSGKRLQHVGRIAAAGKSTLAVLPVIQWIGPSRHQIAQLRPNCAHLQELQDLGQVARAAALRQRRRRGAVAARVQRKRSQRLQSRQGGVKNLLTRRPESASAWAGRLAQR